MATPVEQIKERLSILDVVGQYVTLHKAGRQYKGKSPFTNEKTPSFFVSPERGMYYCFSSGKGGDIFRFIEEMEGVDFRGALKLLAERAGVELVAESPQKRTERETLYAILESATQFFATSLRSNPDIGAYLTKRGVSAASIEKWRIGYVPDEWRALKDHLTKQGFSEALILRSGLIKKSDDGRSFYDVFRGRVMFPIADASGRVVAFSGRTMSADPKLPKYVNSPETELYEKSHILFGYDKAKQSIRSHNFSLIVEGQFDLVLAHQAGFSNTIAISGTALSVHHASLLERLSGRVVLALDADRAGVNSVKRSADILLARGMDVKVATMPEGKDPADLVAENPDLLKGAVRKALTVIEFLIAVQQRSTRDERSFRLAVRNEVLPFVSRIPNRIDREHFEQVVAASIGATAEAVHFEVERIVEKTSSTAQRDAQRADEDQLSHEETTNAPVHADRADELTRFIFGVILWQESAQAESGDTGAFNPADIRAALREAVGETVWQQFTELSESDANKYVFEAERDCASLTTPALLARVHSYLKELTGRSLRTALTHARAALREAEASGDEEAKSVHLAECAALQRRLSVHGDE